MVEIFCLTEQQNLPGLALLPEGITATTRSLADLMQQGWDRPLLMLGNSLDNPEIPALFQRAYHNPAPLLILPPLLQGEITSLLQAPAPVVIARRRANTVELTDKDLQTALGRDNLQLYCTEFIKTALHSGALGAANGRPVIWAYRPTQAATPVLWIAAQLLRVSARTDPLDREELLAALLTWAKAQTQTKQPPARATDSAEEIDPALLRALVVAWSVHPDLTDQALLDWLKTNLFVEFEPAALQTALEWLRNDQLLDAQNHPQAEPLSNLVNVWGLRAFVREARRLEAENKA